MPQKDNQHDIQKLGVLYEAMSDDHEVRITRLEHVD
jgi:hypothetical protein